MVDAFTLLTLLRPSQMFSMMDSDSFGVLPSNEKSTVDKNFFNGENSTQHHTETSPIINVMYMHIRNCSDCTLVMADFDDDFNEDDMVDAVGLSEGAGSAMLVDDAPS